MAIPQMNRIIERIRRTVLLHDGAGLTDAQLLECFIARQEEAAFEAIVRRHGSMVLSVCRRVLGHIHDAEDAFQATFLVLARKAATIRSRELVANWLYGVAFQTALKAKMAAAKRLARERPMNAMPEPEAVAQECSQDWQPLLDHELSSLPEKYRIPIVLCDLEGKTRKQAAQQLGLPEGTLNTRLARARIMLAKRLARHGLTFSGGAIAAILSQNAASAAVSATLLGSTVKAACSIAAGKAVAATLVSAKVAALRASDVPLLRQRREDGTEVAAQFDLHDGPPWFGARVKIPVSEPLTHGNQVEYDSSNPDAAKSQLS